MLCIISIMPHLGASSSIDYVFDVPDELFMLHVAMHGKFQPDQLSDADFKKCKVLGMRQTMKYTGPADNNRKETK